MMDHGPWYGDVDINDYDDGPGHGPWAIHAPMVMNTMMIMTMITMPNYANLYEMSATRV
jgi:hypothetical protein